MTDYELHGPWIGNAMHFPDLPRSYRNRSRLCRVFLLLAVLAVIGGALAGLGCI